MHNLTPIALSPAAGSVGVTVPDAGDGRTAASVTTPIQQLLNMIVWLYDALAGAVAMNMSINGTLNAVNTLSTSPGADITSGRDVTAARTVSAVQDVNAGGFLTGGYATITHNVTAGGTGAFGGALTGASLDIAGGGYFAGPVRMNSGGRIVPNTVYAAGAVGQTASPLVASRYVFPSCATGATIQINDSGATDDDTLTFVNLDSVHQLVLKSPSGATIGGIQHQSAEMTRIAGNWVFTDGHAIG